MRKLTDNTMRSLLAISVVVLSIVLIAALSYYAIHEASDRSETTKLVFSAVLPLLGTWVGTVLAFYFARENFVAAADAAVRLQAGGETGTPVVDVMIKEKDIVAFDIPSTTMPEDVPLADLEAKMSEQKPPSRRLPLRNAAGAVLYVLHDSTLAAFKAKNAAATKFGDMLGDTDTKELVEAVGYVSEKATVADARRKMGSIKNCNDVFVTKAGQREEKAIGWLTNTLLAGIQ
jgi:hypothetical protein